jgi:hypothetical protein
LQETFSGQKKRRKLINRNVTAPIGFSMFFLFPGTAVFSHSPAADICLLPLSGRETEKTPQNPLRILQFYLIMIAST